MIYLILAILCSATISIVMRFSERYIKNKMAMFMANYIICVGMARIFMGKTSLFVGGEGSGVALWLGIISGILYLASFVVMQKNMRYNGVVLSSTFMKLGVVVPTVMAILIFREQPTYLQLSGIILALVAITMIHFEKEQASGENKKGWLIILFAMSGITDSMANIYDKIGSADLKEHYLFYTFLVAFLMSVIMSLKEKNKVCVQDLIFGVLIGVPNYFSARFLLIAMAHVPAVVAYPVYSVTSIILISTVGVLVFKEKISNKKKAAMALILCALVLLNI